MSVSARWIVIALVAAGLFASLWLWHSHQTRPAIRVGVLRFMVDAFKPVLEESDITRHLWKMARLGRAQRDGHFDILWQLERAIEPMPFPAYRTPPEWDRLLRSGSGLPS